MTTVNLNIKNLFGTLVFTPRNEADFDKLQKTITEAIVEAKNSCHPDLTTTLKAEIKKEILEELSESLIKAIIPQDGRRSKE